MCDCWAAECEDRGRHSGFHSHSPWALLQNPTDYIHNPNGPTYQHINMQIRERKTFSTHILFGVYFYTPLWF